MKRGSRCQRHPKGVNTGAYSDARRRVRWSRPGLWVIHPASARWPGSSLSSWWMRRPTVVQTQANAGERKHPACRMGSRFPIHQLGGQPRSSTNQRGLHKLLAGPGHYGAIAAKTSAAARSVATGAVERPGQARRLADPPVSVAMTPATIPPMPQSARRRAVAPKREKGAGVKGSRARAHFSQADTQAERPPRALLAVGATLGICWRGPLCGTCPREALVGQGTQGPRPSTAMGALPLAHVSRSPRRSGEHAHVLRRAPRAQDTSVRR
jgi:hypothetical protein